MDLDHQPSTGGTAPLSATRTAARLAGFALSQLPNVLTRSDGSLGNNLKYLDVGCGNGFITTTVGRAFSDISGVDIEPDRLAEFRTRVEGDQRFRILQITDAALPFESEEFDFITSFEVLEHVSSVNDSISEIERVLAPGGVVVVSVPHTGFPMETHGIQWRGSDHHKKVPLLPYIRPLHRRYALARIFSPRELDSHFQSVGLAPIAQGYAAPQFERAAMSGVGWERKVVAARQLLDLGATLPGLRRLAGVSLIKAYRKEI